MFGGSHENGGAAIAETATLEFGMSYYNTVVYRGVLTAYGHQLKHSLCIISLQWLNVSLL